VAPLACRLHALLTALCRVCERAAQAEAATINAEQASQALEQRYTALAEEHSKARGPCVRAAARRIAHAHATLTRHDARSHAHAIARTQRAQVLSERDRLTAQLSEVSAALDGSKHAAAVADGARLEAVAAAERLKARARTHNTRMLTHTQHPARC
jgi:hypothetical protein